LFKFEKIKLTPMKPTVLFQLFLLLFVVPNLHSQTTTSDPEIFKMVNEVKTENLEAIVKKLVSFGTRHTLSDTKSNTRGIGAAQRWVKSEFDQWKTDL
jgi:hypothetical protein